MPSLLDTTEYLGGSVPIACKASCNLDFASLSSEDSLKREKLRLQEALQAIGTEPPKYSVVSNKEGNYFYCSVTFNGKTFQASASIKKESEQKVAELVLLELDGL